MPHNYSQLYAQFPAVIALMKDTFTSHEFIQRLAQRKQREYAAAASAYGATRAAFRQVHAVLSRHRRSSISIARAM